MEYTDLRAVKQTFWAVTDERIGQMYSGKQAIEQLPSSEWKVGVRKATMMALSA